MFRKERLTGRTIIYGLCAVVLFGVLFAVTFRGFSEEKAAEQPRVVAFGDSVFGLVRDDTSIPALVQKRLGKEVLNAGFGGTCMARQKSDHALGYPKDSLSMAGLAESVLGDDFRVQRAVSWKESNQEYFPEVIGELEQVDFTQVETVLIHHGFNDYHAGTPLDNGENPYDEYTYLGALRCSVRDLRRVNPGLRIVLVTPTYAWYTLSGLNCEEQDFGGGVLEEYVNALMEEAGELNVEVVDLYHDFYPHEKWEDKDIYTRDGVHPNEAGREKIAEKIARELAVNEE